MTERFRPVTDEPARGSIPPAWVFSLPGLDRVRLWTRRLIPTTPFSRLIGFRIGHVSTGSLTGTMKAGSHLLMLPAYNLSPLYAEAFGGCGWTAVDAGMALEPVTFTSQYFRPPRPPPSSFI